MTDKRFSIMVLPRREDGSILLQTWTDEHGIITDGFGSFYHEHKNLLETVQKVLVEKINIKAQLVKAAKLQYFIDKPSGLVDLEVTVYFADVVEEIKNSKEMHWYTADDIPYEQMHPATEKWLPLLLNGNTTLRATIKVDQPGHHATGRVIEFLVT
jgi:hypothetical protein